MNLQEGSFRHSLLTLIKIVGLVASSVLGLSYLYIHNYENTNITAAAGQSGTTLTAEKTAEGTWKRVFSWELSKTAQPGSLTLFSGDSGAVQYTVGVKKNQGTDTYSVKGQVCVTNAGSLPTENFSIQDVVEYKTGSGQYQTLTSEAIDLSAKPVLGPGENNCYPYTITFQPVPGAVYRNVANITITNHSGWLPGGNRCTGPEPCPFGPSPKADFSLPASPVLVNDMIHVTDSDGHSWEFSQTGSEKYRKNYTCDTDSGSHENTAKITEPGMSQGEARATVEVGCYKLTTKKDAATSFTRTYDWTIKKSADQAKLIMSIGQAYDINYILQLGANYTDTDWKVRGTVTIQNPAPISAKLLNVKDVLSDQTSVTLDCGVSFPYTLFASQTLTCTYQHSLPSADNRTNFSTAVQQNYAYEPDGTGTPTQTSDISTSAPVDFGTANISQVDQCTNLSDSLQGALGQQCYADLSSGTKTINYTRTNGPFSTCGTRTIENEATLTGQTTQVAKKSAWKVEVSIPCNLGCTLTIGYWKNHGGFGPQRNMLTPLLPITLGTGGGKSLVASTPKIAVDILSQQVYGAPSNGITKLYAQLLAAKLNIKSGASSSGIASTISAADQFLTNYAHTDWAALSKTQQTQVTKWVSSLDSYNQGLTIVPHCSE